MYTQIRSCVLKFYQSYKISTCIYILMMLFFLLFIFKTSCTTIHRYSIFSTRYSVLCKVYTGHYGTSEIEHGLCASTVDNPLAKAQGLSLRTGAKTMHYLSLTQQACTKSIESTLSYRELVLANLTGRRHSNVVITCV